MLIKGREITAIQVYVEELEQFVEIQYYYIGDELIWASVRSCFGAGYWDNSKPFLNDEAYKN